MQNKGLVICVAVLLTLASIFYLSFSVATSYYDGQAAKIKDPIARQDYKDSVKYLGIYPYQKCLETQIGLGLDLKGGMNVILEISVPDVVDVLADHKTDAAYQKAMKEAKAQEATSQSDFITLFVDNFHKIAPGRKLAEIFATQQLKGKVSTQSSDKEVEKALREEVAASIDNSYNVVRNRIDQFGVVQPNIQKLEGQEGRLMVEMPGIREPERMRKLLQGSANLEFWETYNNQEIAPYLTQLDQRLANGETKAESKDSVTNATNKKQVTEKKTTTKLSLKDDNIGENIGSNAQMAAARKEHPLLSILQLTPGDALSVVGYASVRDTAAVNKIIYSKLAQQVLPSDLRLRWSAKPADGLKQKNIFELHALKVTTSDGRAPLEGDVITDAKDQFDQYGRPEVSMTMNSDGARQWAAITKANLGKAVAIVLDGLVYTAPRINSEITGGSSSISGSFTIEDTKDLANTLKSGRMPAPARIVQEEVVGPTLGAQSIQQGLWSFAIAFVLLMIYMVIMYDVIPGLWCAPVDEKGFVDIEALASLLRADTTLVSIMAVNNEIGSIQPIQAISDLLADKPTISFHVDAVQALAKIPTEKYLTDRVDFATFSSHKFHGVRGVGFVYIKSGKKITPLLTGGGQERDYRSTTENVAGIAATAKALRLAMES